MVEQVLEPVPGDWERGLAVVAHPDDLEYGAASAIARWTAEGKSIAYLLVTRGEAGIADVDPGDCGPMREVEQRASAAVVGVSEVDFLDHRDGLVAADLPLRRDLAAAIRRHRPEVLISINYRDTWGGVAWNHVDHRAVGRALLDAARDAGNPWIFADIPDESWAGVRFAIFNASPASTHAVDISGYLEAGIASLREHRAYLDGLDTPDDEDPTDFLRARAEDDGRRFGVEHATAFELLWL